MITDAQALTAPAGDEFDRWLHARVFNLNPKKWPWPYSKEVQDALEFIGGELRRQGWLILLREPFEGFWECQFSNHTRHLHATGHGDTPALAICHTAALVVVLHNNQPQTAHATAGATSP